VTHVTSESSPGVPVSHIHPALQGRTALVLEKPVFSKLAGDADVVFLALPAGASARWAARFLGRGVRVVDLSADFRLQSPQVYKTWYHLEAPAPKLLRKAVYGLPELFGDDLPGSELVANPGCYATAVILAAAPFLKHHWLGNPPHLVVDAKSGVSGAGKKIEPRYLFGEVNENLLPYAAAHHRHTPEMEQALSRISGSKVKVMFVPHLAPMTRGILADVYMKLKGKRNLKEAFTLYRQFYQGKPFVRVLPPGTLPETKNVSGTNFCDIGFAQDPRSGWTVVFSALDNLVKGASGQAVQCANLMFGLRETEGLL